MSRITEKLQSASRRGGGFIPFVSAGNPDLATSLSIIETLAECGADVVKLGVSFSDPIADGPTIQRSSQRAIEAGTSLRNVIDLAGEFRKKSDVPIVLFSYFNPILRFGITEFENAAKNAGIDGILLTDVIEDEAAAISERFAANGIDLISLVAPTTTDERLEKICQRARGFIYAVSRAGVTGARESTSEAAEKLVARTRQFTDLPIAVGFGISTREQIADVWRYADAAVVGSAIVAVIEQASNPVAEVRQFVNGLLPKFANSVRDI